MKRDFFRKAVLSHPAVFMMIVGIRNAVKAEANTALSGHNPLSYRTAWTVYTVPCWSATQKKQYAKYYIDNFQQEV